MEILATRGNPLRRVPKSLYLCNRTRNNRYILIVGSEHSENLDS